MYGEEMPLTGSLPLEALKAVTQLNLVHNNLFSFNNGGPASSVSKWSEIVLGPSGYAKRASDTDAAISSFLPYEKSSWIMQ